MKAELRAADCLYDNPEHWMKLGGGRVPNIPDAAIQHAYEKGGRVVLKCAHIRYQADALRKAGHRVDLGGAQEQRYYDEQGLKDV